MSYAVVKQIAFCYGHRLLEYEGKCRHLHGHNGVAEIVVERPDLDRRGMVVDFGDVKQAAKAWIDETLDHTLLLRRDDPVIPALKRAGERYFPMAENPTAENIARLIFDELTRRGLSPREVRLWETPDSMAVYRP